METVFCFHSTSAIAFLFNLRVPHTLQDIQDDELTAFCKNSPRKKSNTLLL